MDRDERDSGREPESPEPGSTVAVAARASSDDGFDAVVRLTEAGRQRACKDGPVQLGELIDREIAEDEWLTARSNPLAVHIARAAGAS